MQFSKFTWIFVAKILLAVLLLSALAAVVGADLAPRLPLRTVLLYSFGGALALLGMLVVGLVFSLTFSQFILRIGGTDVQWFWFDREPQGLVHLREELAAQKQESTH